LQESYISYIFYVPLYLVAHVNFLLNEYDDDDDEVCK